MPSQKEVGPGERVTMDCLWECLKPVPGGLGLFVHLEGPGGARIQADHSPEVPTDAWRPGEKMADSFEIVFPENAPAGKYKILLGWYDPRHGRKRLPIYNEDGSKKGSHLKVGEIVCE